MVLMVVMLLHFGRCRSETRNGHYQASKNPTVELGC